MEWWHISHRRNY